MTLSEIWQHWLGVTHLTYEGPDATAAAGLDRMEEIQLVPLNATYLAFGMAATIDEMSAMTRVLNGNNHG